MEEGSHNLIFKNSINRIVIESEGCLLLCTIEKGKDWLRWVRGDELAQIAQGNPPKVESEHLSWDMINEMASDVGAGQEIVAGEHTTRAKALWWKRSGRNI